MTLEEAICERARDAYGTSDRHCGTFVLHVLADAGFVPHGTLPDDTATVRACLIETMRDEAQMRGASVKADAAPAVGAFGVARRPGGSTLCVVSTAAAWFAIGKYGVVRISPDRIVAAWEFK